MKCATALSPHADPRVALDTARTHVLRDLGDAPVDLAIAFWSGYDVADLEALGPAVGAAFPGACVLGCTAEGVIGEDRELERTAATALFVASLPGVELRPFLLRQSDLTVDEAWITRLGLEVDDARGVIALGDPYSFPVMEFITRYNQTYAGRPLVGGLASGGSGPHQNRLLLNDAFYEEGVVGVGLTGDVVLDCVVSQGCRPIGRTFIVTQGEGNVIRAIAGQPPMTVLQEMMGSLSDEDQALLRDGIFVGRAIDEYKHELGRGDFLIQNVIGADPESGAIAVHGRARVGTTVQFHVRDASSADEDLRALLDGAGGERPARPAAGALLFSCNGRGTRMWPEPGHDVGALLEAHPGLPVAGFFCGGEFGPVGGENFLHGFTASIAFLRPAKGG